MKRMIKRLIVVFVSVAIFSCSLFTVKSSNSGTAEVAISRNVVSSDVVDGEKVKLLPSDTPPKTNTGEEIPVSKAPMFVSFGWDDNQYADGMNWSIGLTDGKTNPAGSGQAKTYDGSPITFSYYHTGVYGQNAATLETWKSAYDAGHEVGNHTYNHSSSENMSESDWDSEIDRCNKVLTDPYPTGLGVPLSEIKGFRTPQLNYNDALFNSLQRKGMYDCTVIEGVEYDQNGRNYFWPYTLDEGSPGHRVRASWPKGPKPISNHPGFWVLPVYDVIVPPEIRNNMVGRVYPDYYDPSTGKITGFDYNLWILFKMSNAEFVATLKHTLDLRLKGNRVPMLFGTHTDQYSSIKTNWQNKRAAIEEFLEYALTKSVVRVVSMNQVLDWMKDPVPLQGLATHTITPSVVVNGSIEPTTAVDVTDCDSVTFAFKPDKGYMVDTVTAGSNPVEIGMGSVTVGPVESSADIVVTFKEIPPREPFQGTYYWTYDPEHEPVDMTTPDVDMLDLAGNVLATVPEALAKRIAMEGSGFLPKPDRRLLNLANDEDWPGSRFMVCDQDKAPWGYNSKGEPLVPYKSLAVDPDVIPLGSDVYVEEFDGLRVPIPNDPNGGYYIHDGWWKASDTSHSFSGYQIDFFVATYPNYQEINELLNQISVFQVYCEDQIPGESVYIRASSNRPGAIWPSGDIRVAVGKGEKFYFFPGGDNTIKEVLVNEVPVSYNTQDNTLMVENVITETTVHLVIESPQVTITTKVTNGTITPTQIVEVGSDVTIEFEPLQPDYILEYVKIDDKEEPNITSPYVFKGVTEDHKIEVLYRPPGFFTIETSKSGTGSGTIDPPQTVPGGSNVTINFEADLGSYVADVIVNGDSLDPTPESSYEFINVIADQTIEVVFGEVLNPLTAIYEPGPSWGTGFGASVKVNNIGTETVYGWKVTMTFSNDVSVSGWNGNFNQVSARVVTVTNTSWNGTIQPSETVTFGFNGSYSGDYPELINIKVELQ